MQLFYNPNLSENSKELSFDKIESRHIIKVLRKKEGDLLSISNGKGLLFLAEITFANEKHCIATIINYENKPKPWNYYLHVAIAPTKNIDRLEWFLEKATEIGIDEITPLLCEHSERKIIKKERLQKIVRAAAKQSLKYNIPKLNNLLPFKEFLKEPKEGQLFVGYCGNDFEKKSLKNCIITKNKITILIGPEGDFSPKEIELAIANKFIAVTMGNSRLRTETAGLVAVHSVAYSNEN